MGHRRPRKAASKFDSPIAIGFWTEPGLVARQRDSFD
jgi:hypothetical protein